MFNTQQPSASLRTRNLLDLLNGPWHERALWMYAVVVLAHWIEHLTQAYQIYVLNWPRPAAKGALGVWDPWLVSSEVLHFGYALFMVVGLFLLRPGFQGRSRFWWTLAFAIQIWHFFEHSLLQMQAITSQYLFGAAVPTSILQLWIPRVELHLFYNAAVFIPMIIGMYYHLYPPPGEAAAACGCSRICSTAREV